MTAQFDALPSALRKQGRLAHCGAVPTLLIQAEEVYTAPPPLLLWIHGRTAFKELDPGRYLRLMRRGISVCAIDLPGHGERLDPRLHKPAHIMESILQAVEEVDTVTRFAIDALNADPKRVAIGGMSAGGMVACSRLCRPHLFAAAALESTSGNWIELPMMDVVDAPAAERIAESDPMHHLNHWRPLPLIAIHARLDTWVPFAGQWRFLDALEALGPPSLITRVAYGRTGAPGEHAGFGTMSSDAKDRHANFLAQQLLQQTP